jgi:hypothetical protein
MPLLFNLLRNIHFVIRDSGRGSEADKWWVSIAANVKLGDIVVPKNQNEFVPCQT